MAENKIDIILIGGSAGSLEAILQILPKLTTEFSIPIVIILHRKTDNDNTLLELLTSRTQFNVREVEEKEVPENACLYIAPADYHILFEEDRSFSVDDSEKVNYSRPSIDVAFQSAASVYKDRLLGILLSGANNDGVMGLQSIKDNGGKIMIQDPFNAEMPVMPLAALDQVQPDYLLADNLMADVINHF